MIRVSLPSPVAGSRRKIVEDSRKRREGIETRRDLLSGEITRSPAVLRWLAVAPVVVWWPAAALSPTGQGFARFWVSGENLRGCLLFIEEEGENPRVFSTWAKSSRALSLKIGLGPGMWQTSYEDLSCLVIFAIVVYEFFLRVCLILSWLCSRWIWS